MRACDRHARAEGSLKAAPFEMVLLDTAKLDEMGRPTKLLEQSICPGCLGDLTQWWKTSDPSVLLHYEEGGEQGEADVRA